MEKKVFCNYLKLEVLPDDVKQLHKIKLNPKTPRYDVTAMAGDTTYIDGLKNNKGMIIFYLVPSKEISKKFDRIADQNLQAKDSYNFSGVYLLEKVEGEPLVGFGNPLQDETFGKWRKNKNPFYDVRDDGYVFLIQPDWKQIEIFVVRGGGGSIIAIAQSLKGGCYQKEIEDLRQKAKPIFDYCPNS